MKIIIYYKKSWFGFLRKLKIFTDDNKLLIKIKIGQKLEVDLPKSTKFLYGKMDWVESDRFRLKNIFEGDSLELHMKVKISETFFGLKKLPLVFDIIQNKENKRKRESERRKRESERRKRESERKREIKDRLNNKIINFISKYDQDGNGLVDITESDTFDRIIKKHQEKIVEVDKKYIQKFVKISKFLKTRSDEINEIILHLKKIKNDQELNNFKRVFKQMIKSYNLIQVHSLNMVSSLLEKDMITFYEIYEMFDSLDIFNSKWEKDLTNNLINLNEKISNVSKSLRTINHTNQILVSGISKLSYNINSMKNSVNKQLEDVNSNLNFNNLLTLVNTYQLYSQNKKLSKLTKNK